MIFCNSEGNDFLLADRAFVWAVVMLMQEEDSRVDRVKRFSKIWWQSRADAGKSQEFMALGLGVSKKTIQNWERGISAPDFFQGSEWFRLLKLNPFKYYLAFLYPSVFRDIGPGDEDKKIEEALLLLVKYKKRKIRKVMELFLICRIAITLCAISQPAVRCRFDIVATGLLRGCYVKQSRRAAYPAALFYGRFSVPICL